MTNKKGNQLIQVKIPKEHNLTDSNGNIIDGLLQIRWNEVAEAIKEVDNGILELVPLKTIEIKDDGKIPF